MKHLNDRKDFQNALELFDNNKSTFNRIFPVPVITQALKACTHLQDIKRGSDIHRQIPSHLQNDPFILTSLVHLYMQCGDVKRAELLFNKSDKNGLPLFGAMMKGYIKNNLLHKVIDIFKQIKNPSIVNLVILFNACAKLRTPEALSFMKKVYHETPKSYFSNPQLLTSLMDALMQCHDVEQAELIFNLSKVKVIQMYGAMMKGYVENNQSKKAIDIFNTIEHPNDVIFIILFNACAKLKTQEALHLTKKISNEMPQSFYSNPKLVCSLIDALMKCGDVEYAEMLFNQSNVKIMSTYGAMMNGYVENNQFNKAIDLFHQVKRPDEITMIILFNACAKLRTQEALHLTKRISNEMPQSFYSNPKLVCSLIDALMKCGDVEYAEMLFNQSKVKIMSTYGAMMNGYVENNQFNKAIDLFHQVKRPDEIMITILFNACAALKTQDALNLVKKISSEMPKSLLSNLQLVCSLIDALIKCGDIDQAELYFNESKVKAVQMYGAIMNGFNLENSPLKTIHLFNQMKNNGLQPNLVIYLCIIKALSKVGDYSLCESIIKEIPTLFLNDSNIQGALISMWGKVGSTIKAKETFDKILYPNTIDYSAMINCYGLNGMSADAINLYRRIPTDLLNESTHVCVLNACSHSGYVDEARSIFKNIENKTERIYTTMIDCLGRASLFEDAQSLIDEYERSHPPLVTMYLALLSSARNMVNVDLSKKIYNHMKTVFPEMKNSLIAAAVLLSNVYSSAGDISKASDIKYDLYKSNLKKKVGLSWTVVNGKVYEFRAHDQSHPRFNEINEENTKISRELLEHGHQYDSSWITRPLNQDETVESVLCGHSERLAIAWNFVANPKTTKIQVTKNLRVCGECHRSTKLIALIRQCEITVRDANRIHHFYTNGQCSCNDFF